MIHISDLLAFLESESIPFSFTGDPSVALDRFSSLSHYREGSFTWVKKPASIPEGFDLSRITLAIVAEEVSGPFQNCVRTPQSKHAFFSAIEHFYSVEEDRPPIGQFTYISPKVKLGKNVRIGHNCTLDGDITVGDGTVIWNNVTIINRVNIGKNCDIHSGVVIGHDGFGATEDENHKRTMIKHFGGVTLGNDVYIGENVCISRGTIDDTTLEDGVKIDALGHIAHNCWFGENVGMAVPCSVSGSVHIGKNAYVAGNIIRNQCTVGEGAFIGLGAVVVKDVPAGETVVGNPARPFRKDPKHLPPPRITSRTAADRQAPSAVPSHLLSLEEAA